VIRTLVAAASPVVRAGLEALLTRSASVTVVGVSSGDSLADDIEAHEPQVVLLAVDSSDRSPPAVASITALSPDAASRAPAVVLMAPSPTIAWAANAVRSGARGVLARDASVGEIVAALEAAAVGLATMPAEVAVELASGMRTPVASRERAASTQPLTRREIEVLGMLAEGLANKNIAVRLQISEHTVKTHVASILTKLDAFSRAEAVAIGARQGLILL
jgi:DNA-binding NarL/FixJ family response regulator